jgi:hypothetical protein
MIVVYCFRYKLKVLCSYHQSCSSNSVQFKQYRKKIKENVSGLLLCFVGKMQFIAMTNKRGIDQ